LKRAYLCRRGERLCLYCVQHTVTALLGSGATVPAGAGIPLALQEPAADTLAIMPTIMWVPIRLQWFMVTLSGEPGSEQSDFVYDVTPVSVHETSVGEAHVQVPSPQARLSTARASNLCIKG
jgi:hypothetical protein